MQISVRDLGKKYGRQWIFRHLDFDFNTGSSYAITGPNGSGKSTLLQILTGYLPASHGEVKYFSVEREEVPLDHFYQHLDIVTPYLDLIEEFTLTEFLDFHFKFKQPRQGFTKEEVVNRMYLYDDRDKLLKNFSSGMKQRLKLGIAFYSQSPICFLDEPTSNLDEKGVNWYLENIRDILNEKMVIISSNQKYEYEFCNHAVHIPDFKQG